MVLLSRSLNGTWRHFVWTQSCSCHYSTASLGKKGGGAFCAHFCDTYCADQRSDFTILSHQSKWLSLFLTLVVYGTWGNGAALMLLFDLTEKKNTFIVAVTHFFFRSFPSCFLLLLLPLRVEKMNYGVSNGSFWKEVKNCLCSFTMPIPLAHFFCYTSA